jgi:flagellar basal-body rod protein FlgB
MRQEHGQHPFRHGSADPALVRECPSAYPEVDRVLPASSAVRTMITDVTALALESAIKGLNQRMRVTADNIANVNTPGFLAGRTDFESALSSELASGQTPVVSPGTVARSLEPTNTNGNNVNLDEEEVISTRTGLQYQLALNALDSKYNLLRTALQTS